MAKKKVEKIEEEVLEVEIEEPKPKFPKKVEPCVEKLKCLLTREEREEYSQTMAQSIEDMGRVELEKKQTVKAYDSDIAAIDRKIHDLAQKVKDGYEMRDVNCEIRYDYENKIKIYIRIDTGDEYRRAVMSLYEHQMPLLKEEPPIEEFAGEKLPPAEVSGVEEEKLGTGEPKGISRGERGFGL